MYAIALDIGGTKIECAVVNHKGKILFKKRFATQAESSKNKIMKNIFSTIEYCLENCKKRIEGIGISMPGFINKDGKFVFEGGNLIHLKNVYVQNLIEEEFDLPVWIANDADCLALAEAMYGAGQKYDYVFGVIWGTGIGGGYVTNLNTNKGAIGGFGEFGHIVLESNKKDGRKCNCGHRGCLEMLASGKNIVEQYKQNGGKIKNPDPALIYNSKEKVAREVINQAIKYLGLGLSMVVNITNPEIIIIGGGVSNLPDEVYLKLRKQVKKYAVPVLAKDLKIRRYSISDSAGILGAASLVFNDNQ